MSEDKVLIELSIRWNCEIPFGWIPMCRDATEADAVEIYDAEHFHCFDEEVKHVLQHTFDADNLYQIEEGGTVSLLSLDECVFDYNGLEHIYTDLSFAFIIYFSHESSVTVGGDKLLDEIHRIWPKYSEHFWPPDSRL